MKENLNDYFTTGEFARLFHIKKQTLFYYDQIGILSPELVGENGYRYYSYRQLDTFSTISMLRDLDMPLAQIKEYLDHRSPNAFITLLKKQQSEIEEKIKELQWMQQFIRTKIDLTQKGLSTPLRQIIEEEQPEVTLLTTAYEGADEEKDIAAAVTEHLKLCHSLDIYSAYAIGGMIPVSSIQPDQTYRYSHFYTRISTGDLSSAILKPKGKFLVCCDDHGYEYTEKICMDLLKYAKEHQYKTGPHIYEDLLLDEMSVCGYESYTVKYSLPVL